MTKWKLLEPIKIGSLSLKNRIVMPPMEARLNGPDGSVTRAMIRYYAERAKGGSGLIIVQNTYVDGKASRSSISQGGIHNDHMITGMNELAEEIKSYGARALLQIGHGGRQCSAGVTGLQPVAPSAIPVKGGAMPRELTVTEIVEIQDAFAEAARRAKQAAFDGVEIHGAHGYLVCEFLSPYSNHRTDKYGGGLESRALFALETLAGIRRTVGRDFVVGYRMSADEYVSGGLTLKDTAPFARMLEAAGIDYIHVSAGNYESLNHMVPPTYVEKGHLVGLAAGIKEAANRVPIITVGGLDVETAEKALQDGKADLAAMGRVLIADPDLPKKLAAGQVADIRPCLRGNEGCLSRFYPGHTMRCEVNPACGREDAFRLIPTALKKHVLVVGGGIAGMEAARVAALRGHRVTLLEKTNELGGHLLEASVPRFKEKTKALLEWSKAQLAKSSVDVQIGKEVTPEVVRTNRPEVLIVAVGSDFVIPPIVGCGRSCVANAAEVLLGRRKVGNRVIVIGGGFIGCETALYIAEELGSQVTIVEMLDEILIGVEDVSRLALNELMEAARIGIHTSLRLEEIIDQGALGFDKKRQKYELRADTIVLATGLRARQSLVERFCGLTSEVYVIGDCFQARKIYSAFEDAWRAGLAI